MAKLGKQQRGKRMTAASGICFEPLEPRLLLSGSWGSGAEAPTADTQSTPGSEIAPAGADFHLDRGHADAAANQDSGPVIDLLAQAPALNAYQADAEAIEPTSPIETSSPETATQRELVFVDAGIRDYNRLVDDLLSTTAEDTDFEVIVLDAKRDGVAQISEALAEQQNLDAVHFVSHGSDGAVQLGRTLLTSSNIDTYANDIADWQDALTQEADLLFYGCELAASDDGRALLDTLGVLTGADVAASDDLTGSAPLGGDWELEYISGDIEAGVAYAGDTPGRWTGLLGQITVTTTDDVLDADADTSSLSALSADPGSDGEISLREAIKAANTDLGADTITLGTGNYLITRTGLGDDHGDFDIRDDLSIVGVSPSETIVDGNNFNRVFEVHNDASITVSFSDLRIQNGLTGAGGADGAGLLINGGVNTPSVYLSNIWFSGNTTTGFGDEGGAVYNQGDLTVTNTLVEGSTSGRGGGIYNAASGTLRLTNVTISGNNAEDAEAGGLYNQGSATLRNVTIADNNAATQGGGSLSPEEASISPTASWPTTAPGARGMMSSVPWPAADPISSNR